jgi:hypothetical protein
VDDLLELPSPAVPTFFDEDEDEDDGSSGIGLSGPAPAYPAGAADCHPTPPLLTELTQLGQLGPEADDQPSGPLLALPGSQPSSSSSAPHHHRHHPSPSHFPSSSPSPPSLRHRHTHRTHPDYRHSFHHAAPRRMSRGQDEELGDEFCAAVSSAFSLPSRPSALLPSPPSLRSFQVQTV